VSIHPALRARDPRGAAHTIALVLAVCAVVFGLYALLAPDEVTRGLRAVVWPSMIVCAVFGLVFAVVPPERLDGVGALVIFAVLGTSNLCLCILFVGTASIGTQFFLALAVLYAGFHLYKAAVVLVTATALVGNAVVLLVLEPVGAAVTDFLFSSLTLLVMAALLVRSGQTRDRLVAELERQAAVDALTGLVTRRAFDEALEAALSRPAGGEGNALVLIDVDDFKSINDRYGHPVGDDTLVHLAGIITACVRSGDAVVSRLGGDELAVLLVGCPPEVAERRSAELLDAVRAAPLMLPGDSAVALSVSIGVAHAPRDAGDRRGLYVAADAALYEAKRSGRGRVAVTPA
jgi:diguanylate cyclase (GGDEF)-like protein